MFSLAQLQAIESKENIILIEFLKFVLKKNEKLSSRFSNRGSAATKCFSDAQHSLTPSVLGTLGVL